MDSGTKMEIATCDNCGHKQDARKGFECEKCGGQTFTEKEEKELIAEKPSKFVPLNKNEDKCGKNRHLKQRIHEGI